MIKKVARIVGLGTYLPEKILHNQDLEKLVDTSHEWIVTRTGMIERRIAAANEFPSDMGTNAAKNALKSANIPIESVEMILVASMSPDYISPSTANLIQANLGAEEAASMDVQAACTGFLYALGIAKGFIESGMYQTILVIATEKMSAFLDYQDRTTCILFGDGAGAAVVADRGEGFAIDAIDLGSDGKLADLVKIPAGGSRLPASLSTVERREHYFRMSGNEVFKHAVRRMSAAASSCLKKAGLSEKEINWLVPHQANKRIIDALAKQFEFPQEKVFQTVHKYGNTSASSVVIALSELLEQSAISFGDYILLLAFGGGLTWGASILKKIKADKK